MHETKGTFINYFAGISGTGDIPSKRMEAMLVNVPHIMKYSTSVNNTREVIKETGAKQVMMDSGGYTIFNTYQKNGNIKIDGSRVLISGRRESMVISTEKIVESALKIQPHIVIGLDHPIIKTKDPIMQEEEYRRKKAINLLWMKEISELRSIHCPHIELYLPIQCYNLDQFDDLAGELTNLKFDGLALPTRNMNPIQIARFLYRINEIGIRKVHLLGTSCFSNLAMATYFARNVFERCSIDSSTWRNAATYHDYIHPVNLLNVSIGRKSTESKHDKLPCRCKLCRGNTYGQVMDLSVSERRRYLKQHNYHAVKKAGEDFFRHALAPDAFEWFLRNRAPQREKDIDMIMQAIRIADSHKRVAIIQRAKRAA